MMRNRSPDRDDKAVARVPAHLSLITCRGTARLSMRVELLLWWSVPHQVLPLPLLPHAPLPRFLWILYDGIPVPYALHFLSKNGLSLLEKGLISNPLNHYQNAKLMNFSRMDFFQSVSFSVGNLTEGWAESGRPLFIVLNTLCHLARGGRCLSTLRRRSDQHHRACGWSIWWQWEAYIGKEIEIRVTICRESTTKWLTAMICYSNQNRCRDILQMRFSLFRTRLL